MKTVSLAEACEITMGQAPKGDTYNDHGEGLPLVAGAGDFGELNPAPKKFTTAAGVRQSEPGDIIVGIRASIGAKVMADDVYCLGRGVAGLRARANTDQRYLWNWIGFAASALKAKGRGATFLQVNKRDVAEMQIPLPPLEEQRRIAAVLDAADALRAKRRQAIAKLDTLTQALFIDMFGDSAHTPTALGEFVEMLAGPAWKSGEFSREPDGLPLIRIQNVGTGNRDFVYWPGDAQDRYRIRKGDLLLTLSGSFRCEIWEQQDALLNQRIVKIDPDETVALRPWLMQALVGALDRVAAMARDAVISNVSLTDLRSFVFNVPSLALQTEFSRQAQQIKARRAETLRSAQILDDLFASLQQRAFRGEL